MDTKIVDYKNSIQKLRKFFRVNKYLPATREIAELLGYQAKSKTQVIRILQNLVTQDYLDQTESGRYVPGTNFFSYPLFSGVQAGNPTIVDDEQTELLDIESMIIPDPDHSFMVTVRGESMKDAGILPGDVVVVHQTNKAKVGDVVIAEMGGELTVKYYREDNNGKPYLEPANSKFNDIHFDEESEVRLVGKVDSVIRKLG